MDASSTSSSRVARAANAYRAPAAAALTRPGGSSAFAAAAVLGGNHRIVGVVAPSTCFAAAARPAHPAAFSAASADEGQGLMSRMYAVAMGSRQAAAGGAAGIIARTASHEQPLASAFINSALMICLVRSPRHYLPMMLAPPVRCLPSCRHLPRTHLNLQNCGQI